jgi:putative addiction module CopG family antidote
MSRTLDLADDLDRTLDDLVRTGRFSSREDVLRAGLELLLRQEAARRGFEDAVDRGLDEAARGRVVPLVDVFDDLEARIGGRPRR